jgi:RNA polymerase sigma factor (sigma-70 family)
MVTRPSKPLPDQPTRAEDGPAVCLDQISTRWSLIGDPAQFVLRYAPAIRRYLGALLRDGDAVEEVVQEFLLRVCERRFTPEQVERGRFRAYLKAAVRNAALSYLRRKPAHHHDEARLRQLPADGGPPSATDQAWLDEWRRCLLDRAWEALEDHQRRTPGNLAHTVLRLAVDHPGDDSPALAARAGRPLRADAFRKQLSRARRLFARFLVSEVAQTLEAPTPEQVEEELCDLGLLHHVRPFLPPDWRTHGRLPDPD